MRLTDDIADEPFAVSESELSGSQPTPLRQEKLLNWRSELREAISGNKTTHPLFPALVEVVHQYQIDPAWLEDLIDGVQLDLQPLYLAAYPDLQKYCYHVAGTAGLCCQAIWGADLSQTKQLAITCGEAFQLTNILRDLHEDACNNRCYLPVEDLERFGCSMQTFASQIATPAFRDLIDFQIQRTYARYQQAALLEQHLHGAGLKMFRRMFCTYYQIFRNLALNPEKSLKQRTRVPKWKKIQILLSAGSCSLEKMLTSFPAHSA